MEAQPWALTDLAALREPPAVGEERGGVEEGCALGLLRLVAEAQGDALATLLAEGEPLGDLLCKALREEVGLRKGESEEELHALPLRLRLLQGVAKDVALLRFETLLHGDALGVRVSLTVLLALPLVVSVLLGGAVGVAQPLLRALRVVTSVGALECVLAPVEDSVALGGADAVVALALASAVGDASRVPLDKTVVLAVGAPVLEGALKVAQGESDALRDATADPLLADGVPDALPGVVLLGLPLSDSESGAVREGAALLALPDAQPEGDADWRAVKEVQPLPVPLRVPTLPVVLGESEGAADTEAVPLSVPEALALGVERWLKLLLLETVALGD